jgi:hypothetical protein
MSKAESQAVGYDAEVSHDDLRNPVVYLTRRADELNQSIASAEAVAAGAKQTAATLREELKQVKAELRAAADELRS